MCVCAYLVAPDVQYQALVLHLRPFARRLPIRAFSARVRLCVCVCVDMLFVCTGHWHGARVPAPVPRSKMTKSSSHPNVQPQRGSAEKGCHTWSGRYARFVVNLPTVATRAFNKAHTQSMTENDMQFNKGTASPTRRTPPGSRWTLRHILALMRRQHTPPHASKAHR